MWSIVEHVGKVKYQQRVQDQYLYLYIASICPPFNSGCEQNPRLLRTHYGLRVIVFLNTHNRIKYLLYFIFHNFFQLIYRIVNIKVMTAFHTIQWTASL